MSVKITNHTNEFLNSYDNKVDMVLSQMSAEILRLALMKTPLSLSKGQFKKQTGKTMKSPASHGALRNSAKWQRISDRKYIIIYAIVYAWFQEAGGDATRRVRNYSTPGTGAHFLENAVNKIKNTFSDRMKSL